MAPIGTITTGLTLEKPHFQGANDPISGTVSITFRPNAAHQELFGPIHLRLVLEGQMKLHVSENRTSHAYIFFDETRLLLRKTQDVLNGPFRVLAGKSEVVPFLIQFPTAANANTWGAKGENLPPSFKTRIQAQAVRQLGKHQGSAKVEYSLRVEAELPGIDVEVVNDPDTIIQYEQPSRPIVNAGTGIREISQTLQVETHKLLPEDQRPSSLLGRTKAVLNNVPKPVFVFTATSSRIPDAVAVGQSVQFDIRLRIDSEATTATAIPDISLSDGEIDIIARTELYATNEKGINSPLLEESAVVHSLKLTKQIPEAGPFAKASDYTKTLEFAALPSNIPSSFSVTKLSRSYRAELELRFVIAGAGAVVMRKQIGLQILSPESVVPPSYTRGTRNGTSRVGPSRLRLGSVGRNEHEELPRYEEAVSLAPESLDLV